jgi:hypothetical protein
MHYNVGILVYAYNEIEARSIGLETFEQKQVGDGSGNFDYCTATQVLKADTPEWKKEIKERVEWTRDNFLEALKNIRKCLARFTDKKLYEQDYPPKGLPDFRYNCYKAGKFSGPGVYLYDQDGEGIRDPEHLQDVLAKWAALYEGAGKVNPNDGKDIYIVSIDAHS